MAESDIKLFVSIGLSDQKAKETLKNEQVTENLKQAIQVVRTEPVQSHHHNHSHSHSQ